MDPETGSITLPWELLAGGTAGGCQVVSFVLLPLTERCADTEQVFTNPLEIV